MSVRTELLEFLAALQNEIGMAGCDPEESRFAGEKMIIEKMQSAIAAIEHIFPMLVTIEEVMYDEISTKYFKVKWVEVAAHMGLDDELGSEDIGGDVNNFLGGFSRDSGDGVDTDDEDDE